VSVRYGDLVAVRAVDLDLAAGQVTALMGRNGSGKTSLLWALQGSGPRSTGTVRVGRAGADPAARSGGAGRDGAATVDPATLPARKARAVVGLVPQTPSDLLYLETVGAECSQADADADAPAGTCRALLDRLASGIGDDQHPRDLSEGQRLCLVLAVQLTAAPAVLLLDEATRGLDYHAKRRLGEILAEQVADGRAVLLSTHDVEFVAAVADRVVVLAEGDVVADGPTAEVIVASPALAPQVAKVLHPAPWLTVADVATALEEVTAE
jgi:energy-coupling factor transport system ATP-binding protein